MFGSFSIGHVIYNVVCPNFFLLVSCCILAIIDSRDNAVLLIVIVDGIRLCKDGAMLLAPLA